MIKLLKARFETADGHLLPQTRLAGPMPWVIAIMVALTVIAAAAGLSLNKTTRSAQNELSGGITVQIVEADPDSRGKQAKAALTRLQAASDVKTAKLIPQNEIDSLIEPWLGKDAMTSETIPVPAMIDVQLYSMVSAERLASLREMLRDVAPAARVDAQSSWLEPVFNAIQSLQWLVVALVLLLAAALAFSVLLAARSTLGANKETIEIIHLLGGTDKQIARVFQRTMAIDAAGGGLLGLLLGLIAVLVLGQRFALLGAGLVSSGSLDWAEWLMLALVPIAAVILATLTARLSVLRALRRMV